MSYAAGLNDDRHWEPYLWIGLGVVVLIVVVVLVLHRHRQRAADRTMGSTFTAAGFSALMDNLSWYGQSADPVTGEQPAQRADLGYRAGLQAAQNQGFAPVYQSPPVPYESQPYPPQYQPQYPAQPYPPQPPPDPWMPPGP
ncbi:MAG TPA: hypothetical protein VHC49_09945 [Mycobacteriales bacterium]|nr:hypothetical protein [Mycobacteriales bacterium]